MGKKNIYLINIYEADLICELIDSYIDEMFDDIFPLEKIGRRPRDITLSEHLKSYVTEIDNYIEDNCFDNKTNNEIYKLIEDKLECERISNSDLNWIDIKNKRLCNWLWHEFIEGNILNSIDIRYKNRLRFRSSAMNFKEKYLDIIKFLKESNSDKNTKLILLSNLKDFWSEIVRNDKVKGILDQDNTSQCIWAYNYILKKFNAETNNRLDFAFLGFESNELSSKFKINDDSDYYFNVITYFDLITNTSEKFYKIDCLKKAWNQKKYRESNNGKKPYNFNMSVSIADKLTKMSEGLNTNKNLLIEQLIENKYKEFINDK